MEYDLIVKNGCIVDGTGMPRQFGDLGIVGGTIASVAADIPAHTSKTVIDAAGRIVAPGVIDPHTHYDAQVHWDPYCANSSWHGNTTVVVGNCGFGFAPCEAGARERYMAMMENTEQVPINAMRQALPWNWESYPEWVQHIRQQSKGVNLASFLPLNSLMIYVMGYEAAKSRGATQEERSRMRDLLNEAMDVGAIGFALSNLHEFNSHKDTDGSPMPTDSMVVDDAYYLAEVLKERNQGVIQCLCELPGGISNRETAEELARVSGRPVLHNVVAAFDGMPEFHREVLRWLDRVEAEGLNIYSQAFAFRAWNEFNVVDYDTWQHVPLFHTFTNAGDARGKALLSADPAFLDRARNEYNPDAMQGAGGPLESLYLQKAAAEKYIEFEGWTVGDVADSIGRPVTDVFFDIVACSEAQAEFRTSVATSTDPDKIEEILQHSRTIPGTSDGGAHVKFHSGGQYATDNLMFMVREEGRISLEQMHFQLSYMPARILGLHQRGALLEGYAADLYVYDFNSIGYDYGAYETVHDLPAGDWRRVCPARGIDWVVVNGEPIFKKNSCTGALPGRLLGNGGAALDEQLKSTG